MTDLDDFIPPAPAMQAPGLPPGTGASWDNYSQFGSSQGMQCSSLLNILKTAHIWMKQYLLRKCLKHNAIYFKFFAVETMSKPKPKSDNFCMLTAICLHCPIMKYPCVIKHLEDGQWTPMLTTSLIMCWTRALRWVLHTIRTSFNPNACDLNSGCGQLCSSSWLCVF